MDEDQGDGEEGRRQDVHHRPHPLGGQADGEFDGEQAEEGRELDNGVERHRRGVLEGVPDGVADDRGVVQGRALHVQVDLDDLLRVVPRAPGVGHVDRLIQAEDRDRHQVADEQEGLDEGQGQRDEEDRQEDGEHPLLGVLGADLDHPAGVLHRGPLRPGVQVDGLLDEGHRPVGARGDRLDGGPGEPEDDGAPGDQAQEEGGVHEGQVLDAAAQVVGQADNDGEDHGGGAHDRGADEDGLGGGLEGVAGAVVVLQEVLGPLPPGGEAEVSADIR